jgi:hypothetical protein
VGREALAEFLDFVEDTLFGYVDFDDQVQLNGARQLNRHVLAHGRGTRQWTRMNALRSFLLLDVLGAVVLSKETDQ